MKKLILVITVLISLGLYVQVVNAEICIAGRCTDASSIGSISVTSSMTKNYGSSWDCSGPGCSAFERRQSRPMQLQKVRPITKLQIQRQEQTPASGSLVRLKLRPGYRPIMSK